MPSDREVMLVPLPFERYARPRTGAGRTRISQASPFWPSRARPPRLDAELPRSEHSSPVHDVERLRIASCGAERARPRAGYLRRLAPLPAALQLVDREVEVRRGGVEVAVEREGDPEHMSL